MIIGISGRIGSGKDTIADILVQGFDFTRMAMADAMRAECAEALDTGIAPVGCPGDIRQIIENKDWLPRDIYEKPTPPGMRWLLQWWGSEHRRSQDQEYWAKIMRVRLSYARGHVVIPDIRFANEAALVREFGGSVWIVRRQQADALGGPQAHSHISERFCQTYTKWDYEIDNHGTMAELEEKVIFHMDDIRGLASLLSVAS